MDLPGVEPGSKVCSTKASTVIAALGCSILVSPVAAQSARLCAESILVLPSYRKVRDHQSDLMTPYTERLRQGFREDDGLIKPR